jgi:diguanylate cyclase (GGDEF)-like protein
MTGGIRDFRLNTSQSEGGRDAVSMTPDNTSTIGRGVPRTRSELEMWIRHRLGLTGTQHRELLAAIDAVLDRQQRLWQESKQDAIKAISDGFADKIAALRTELLARDATVSSISRYFEDLVANLSDRSHRDPKTKLMNFDWFMDQLESFLELEQRVRWCAVGLVDIAGFKWYNDALGHGIGDRIIEGVSRILREQIRSVDLIAQELTRPRSPDLHARFGGDEFCFLIPDLSEDRQALVIAERFREAVGSYDWQALDAALAAQPVRVDVGVVCLWTGPVGERRPVARRLAVALVDRADRLMYAAKGEKAEHVAWSRMHIAGGRLVEFDGQHEAVPKKYGASDAQRWTDRV